MQVVKRVRYYEDRKPTVKEAINAKMKVLREFYVVDESNDREIRAELKAAVDAHPGRDYELVLDQVAHRMIAEKLS
jgi:hypothetical protein